MDWNKIWNSVTDFFTNNFWNIVMFFSVLVIGIIVVKIILNITKRLLRKTKIEKVTQSFLHHIIKFCLYLILILILLNIMGISISGLLTTISALVLAIGMALQNIITNIANGIVIVTTGMFKKGDFISVSGVDGSVLDINFLFTSITTTDNKKITIPNSDILNNPVTNYGANPTRRVDFSFDVAYESDVELVKKVILDVINSNGKVRGDKEPFCRLKLLESSSIKFVANCWVDSEDYWDVYYYVVENVFNEFKRHNISIPYNQLEIRERKDNVKMPVIGDGLKSTDKKVRVKSDKIDLENDGLLEILHKKKKANKKAKKVDNAKELEQVSKSEEK